MNRWENPIHQWTFDEGNGSVVKDKTGGANGTLTNVFFDSPGRVGNYALHFGPSPKLGVIPFVSFGNSVGQFGTKDFTVAFWFKTNDTSDMVELLGNRTVRMGYGNYFSICLHVVNKFWGWLSAEVCEDDRGTNHIQVKSQNLGGFYGGNACDGSWHHLVIVRQSTTLKMYIDGMWVRSESTNGIANIGGGRDFRLGASGFEYSPAACFDDLRIYDFALTDAEIIGDDNAGILGLFRSAPPPPQILLQPMSMPQWYLYQADQSYNGVNWAGEALIGKVRAVLTAVVKPSEAGASYFFQTGTVALEDFALSPLTIGGFMADIDTYLSQQPKSNDLSQVFVLEPVPKANNESLEGYSGNYQKIIIKASNGMYVSPSLTGALRASVSQSGAGIFALVPSSALTPGSEPYAHLFLPWG